MRTRAVLTVSVVVAMCVAGLSGTVPAAPTATLLPATVGLVDSSTGIWHLHRPDGTAHSFYYGDPGDYPMLGDWDCDGDETPGLYRQSDGYVYLRNANTQGTADIRFFFGDPNDVPLAGDFDGDGCDTVSIYRQSEGRMYVINELGSGDQGLGAADLAYYFGNPGDEPFVGDFDGDGIDELGLHRESTGFVYMRMTHTAGIADDEFFYGDPGDRIVAGDWTGDGTDTVAIRRPSDAKFYFRYTNTAGVADYTLSWGGPAWLPVAGMVGFDFAPAAAGLPSAYPRDALPWQLVGDGWSLVLYNASVEFPSYVPGPTALYVVSPGGLRFEMARWPASTPQQPAPWAISDWKPDGTQALLHAGPTPTSGRQIWLLDLVTGGPASVVFEAPQLAGELRAGFTRPTGANLVVYREQSGTEVLERRTTDGALLATLADQPTGDPDERITWLYDFDGDSVILGDTALRRVGVDGTVAGVFASPGFGCDPVRWWSPERFLAKCLIEDPAINNVNYHRLWLVPTDGGPATPLTAAPTTQPQVVDFGHVDALRTHAGVTAQWAGDCEAGAVHHLLGGMATPVPITGSLGSSFLEGLADNRMLVSTGAGCDTGRNLLSNRFDGSDPIVLVPQADGARGVEDVATLPRP